MFKFLVFIFLRSVKGTIMSWNEEEDILFCKEILVSKLFSTKKSSPERGQVWNDIADTPCKLHQPIFRVIQKSVRDHYNKLKKYKYLFQLLEYTSLSAYLTKFKPAHF